MEDDERENRQSEVGPGPKRVPNSFVYIREVSSVTFVKVEECNYITVTISLSSTFISLSFTR